MPHACIDVAYADTHARAACVLFNNWTDSAPAQEHTVTVQGIEPYVPGEFYRRELPCILRVLQEVQQPLDTVVIDGYVWLGEKKGLGAHLYDALKGAVPVIGVAKTQFATATPLEVQRVPNVRPLYVTACGMDVATAARHVHSMHGPSRIPTLIKRADTLSRQ